MSQENVEIVRAALAAWNTGDTDTVREAMDPNGKIAFVAVYLNRSEALEAVGLSE